MLAHVSGLWYGLAFIMNKNRKNKIYKLRNVDERIPVIQLNRSRSKKQKEPNILIEEDGFKPGSKLD